MAAGPLGHFLLLQPRHLRADSCHLHPAYIFPQQHGLFSDPRWELQIVARNCPVPLRTVPLVFRCLRRSTEFQFPDCLAPGGSPCAYLAVMIDHASLSSENPSVFLLLLPGRISSSQRFPKLPQSSSDLHEKRLYLRLVLSSVRSFGCPLCSRSYGP